MFEGKLTSVLNKLLGEYVHGISAKDLSVAVFKGDVVLKNLRLKTEALNALDLPFVVRSGLVGKLSLQIPWRALGKQPVVATIERLYVVAGFADDVEGDDALTVEERTERWEKAKAALRRREIDEGETRWLESALAAEATRDDATKNEDAKGDGWLAGMLDTVLGNLEVSISKIHVRLEGDLVETGSGNRPAGGASRADHRASSSGSTDSRGERFAAGATLESLVINTVDASGAAAFTVGGLAERMRKSAKLTGLAVYFDVGADSLAPNTAGGWESVSPDALVAAMEPGVVVSNTRGNGNDASFVVAPVHVMGPQPGSIDGSTGSTAAAAEQANRRQYLLEPVSASAYYERRGKREPAARNDVPGSSLAPNGGVPAQRIHLRIDSVAARLTSSHLRAAYVAAERLERDARRAPHAHLRPRGSGSSSIVSIDGARVGGAESGARAWWRFAVAAVTLRIREETLRAGGRYRSSFRVDEVVRAMRARREYVESYVQNAIAPHPRPMTKKKPNKRWPPLMDVGSVPAMDAVEARYPAHVCVLFRAIAHQQARRRGLIRDVDEDDGGRGVAGGFFRVFGFSGKSRRDAESSNSASAEEGGDADMSEDDWAKLDAVFDVGARAEAATDDSHGGELATAPQSEATIAVGSVSLKVVDDEAETCDADDANDENRANTSTSREVLNASVTGLVAGARSFGGGGADARCDLRAMDLDVGGAKILRSAGAKSASSLDDWAPATGPGGSRSSSEAPGCVTASRVAAALWGRASGAGDSPAGDSPGGGVESGDEDEFVDASDAAVEPPVDESMDVNQTAVEPPEALSLRFEKLAKAPSQNSGIDDPNGSPSRPDVRVGIELAPARVTLLRAPVQALVRTLTRHKPAQLAEQEELLRRAVARGASDAARGAREALVAALADRPVVDVSMTVHAPRVAVPSRYLRSKEVSEVPSGERGVHKEVSNDDELDAENDDDDATLLLDLGRFELRTVPATDLGADARDAKLFNAFRVKISDVAASLLPGGWDPNGSWRKVTGGGAGLNSDLFQPSGPRSLLPLLPPFGAEATALQALAPVPGRASMEISFRAGI